MSASHPKRSLTNTPSHAPITIAAYTRGGAPTATQFRDAFGAIGRLVATNLA